MLTYLILTTRAVLMEAAILGVMTGWTKISAGKPRRRIVWAFAVIGVLFSIFIAVMRNTTSMIDTAILNGWIYTIGLTAFVLFLIFTIKKPSDHGVLSVIPWVFLGVICVTIIAYAMPDVWAYPYHVLQQESTIISTEFLMSMIGMTVGLILAVVTFLASERCTRRLGYTWAAVLLRLELLINAALRLSNLFSVLLQKKIVKSNHTMFTYTVFMKNHKDWFLFLALALVVLAAAGLWAASLRQKEPYRNPAEHRKIRAKWRSIRRWASTAVICFVFVVLNLTVIEKANATDVTLSPVEEVSSVDDENVYVGFDLVEDGHLHRFAYETENGAQIRFIVIKKPNGNSYGIGLDACDVCGETGYYEKDGQVVCNLCDVVMNISTIGFKGGCNPIVIPYEVNNGQIIVPISGLLEYEREFK
ncbi:MAG: DUF2318 domain-containing protein [Lachnospiraceae bacterium]|nr:DUF2318 domain-containing protein [Lachnospiraceae bacterium]